MSGMGVEWQLQYGLAGTLAGPSPSAQDDTPKTTAKTTAKTKADPSIRLRLAQDDKK
jgi:hypothetical protein